MAREGWCGAASETRVLDCIIDESGNQVPSFA